MKASVLHCSWIVAESVPRVDKQPWKDGDKEAPYTDPALLWTYYSPLQLKSQETKMRPWVWHLLLGCTVLANHSILKFCFSLHDRNIPLDLTFLWAMLLTRKELIWCLGWAHHTQLSLLFSASLVPFKPMLASQSSKRSYNRIPHGCSQLG